MLDKPVISCLYSLRFRQNRASAMRLSTILWLENLCFESLQSSGCCCMIACGIVLFFIFTSSDRLQKRLFFAPKGTNQIRSRYDWGTKKVRRRCDWGHFWSILQIGRFCGLFWKIDFIISLCFPSLYDVRLGRWFIREIFCSCGERINRMVLFLVP